jgi:Holliday junction resolvasome RuvABC endonuclease subunit
MVNHHHRYERRVLAVDPHIDRIGYAYFDGARLADWGMTTTRHALPAVRVRRYLIPSMRALLDRFGPQVLIVPKVGGRGWVRRSRHVVAALGVVTAQAHDADVAVYAFTNREVKRVFSDRHGQPARNKTVINRLIVERYPELTTSMPKARRPWDPERYYTPLFNAVSLYWAWRDAAAR